MNYDAAREKHSATAVICFLLFTDRQWCRIGWLGDRRAAMTRGAKVEQNSSNYKTVWKVGKVVLVIRNRYTRRRRRDRSCPRLWEATASRESARLYVCARHTERRGWLHTGTRVQLKGRRLWVCASSNERGGGGGGGFVLVRFAFRLNSGAGGNNPSLVIIFFFCLVRWQDRTPLFSW